MEKSSKIFVTGHRGLAGSAIVRGLKKNGYNNLVLRTHSELDLINQKQTEEFFMTEKPEYVFHCAARMGGIFAAFSKPAQFLYENSMMQNNVIHSAYLSKVKKLLFLGSSCVYPKHCPQPIKEEYLMTGPLETTNDAFAMGKIEGIYSCQGYNRQYGTNFISVMPSNLYGENDNFDPNFSHVLPALMGKFHAAKTNSTNHVELWGSGTPRREFLHVDDLSEGCIFLMQNYNDSTIINMGSGTDVTIRELAEMMREVTGFRGEITWNPEKPDGTPRKLLDVTKLKNLGWKQTIDLKEGLKKTYDWYVQNIANTRTHYK